MSEQLGYFQLWPDNPRARVRRLPEHGLLCQEKVKGLWKRLGDSVTGEKLYKRFDGAHRGEKKTPKPPSFTNTAE